MSNKRQDELKKRLDALNLPDEPDGQEGALSFIPPASSLAPEGGVLETPQEERGLRLEGDRWIVTRTPLTPFGWGVLRSLRTQVFPGSEDLPAMLAAAAQYQRQRFLLEAIASEAARWDEEEVALVRDVLEQTALALEHADLFRRIQAALNETERMYRGTTAINQASTYEEVLAALREFTIVGQDALYVSLTWFEPPMTREQQPEWMRRLAYWKAHDAVPDLPERVEFGTMAVGDETPTLEPVVVVHPNVETDPNVHPAVRQVTLFLGGRCALWAPFTLGESMLGFLYAAYPEEKRFSEAEQRILQALVTQASARLSTLYLGEQTRQALEETERLYKAAVAISEADTYQQLLDVLREYTLFGKESPSYMAIVLFEPSLTEERRPEVLYTPAYWTTLPEVPIPERAPFAAFSTGEESPFRPGMILVHEDVETDPTVHPPVREVVRALGGRAVVILGLSVGMEMLGFAYAVYPQPRTFPEGEMRFLATLASHLAVRVQSMRLTEEMRHLLNLTERLYEASAALNQSRTLEEVLETLEHYTVLGRDSLGTLLVTFDPPLREKGGEFRGYLATHRLHQTKAEEYLQPCVVTGDDVQYLRDLFLRFSTHRLTDLRGTPLGDYLNEYVLRQGLSAQSALFVPLWVGDEVVGVVVGLYEHPFDLGEEEAQELLALQAQVAVRVDGLLHHERAQNLAQQLRTVAEIARDIGAALSVQELLDKAVELIRERFDLYHVSVFLLDPQGLYAEVQASTGPAGEVMKRSGHRLAVGSPSVVGQAVAQGRPVVVNAVEQSPIYRPNPLLPETQSEAAIPLKVGERILGALDVQSTRKFAFTETSVQVFQLLADQLAIAVESARAYDLSRRALEEMRRADELKTQFLANMSHELRTPLNSIIGFSRIILKGIDGPITEQQRQDLEAIYNAGQHLLGLINDILDLSKIEAGKMELVFEEVDLKEVLEGVLSTTRGLLKDKPVELRVDIAPELPPISADAKRIRQILLNVLSNAAKFTEKGFIRVQMRPTVSRVGLREVLIVVEDTGPGIPKEAQERLFTPFYQADAAITRAVGGTGLGLAITRHLVELHGGRIWIESEEGQGTKVFITLPVTTGEAARAAFTVVFDVESHVETYREYFGPKGYRVVGTLDPKEFQARVLALNPFALVINPFLPDRQGLQLLYQLQVTEETRRAPTLLATLVEERRLFLPPFVGFYTKPIEDTDLAFLQMWARASGHTGPMRLLVVERDTAHAENLQALQKRLVDVEMDIVATYNEAFERFRQGNYQAAMVDLLAGGDMTAFLNLVLRQTEAGETPFPVVGVMDRVLTPETWGLLDLLVRQWWRSYMYSLDDGLAQMERYFAYFNLLQREQPMSA